MFAALDFESARAGIGKDIRVLAESGVFGWVVLSVVFSLPMVSAGLLLRSRWLAVIPLSLSLRDISERWPRPAARPPSYVANSSKSPNLPDRPP